MLKDFVYSMKGKISVVIFFLIALMLSFSLFVIFQNNIIQKKTKLLNKNSEPTITLTFIFLTNLTEARAEISNKVLMRDTSKSSYFEDIRGCRNILLTIKLHCDTLKIIDNEANYTKVLLAINNYEKIGKNIFDVINDHKYNNKYSEIEVDSILKSLLINSESPGYWNAFNEMFSYNNTFRELKDDLMSTLLSITVRTLWIVIFLAIFIVILSFLVWRNIFNYVSSSINQVVNHLNRIATGELFYEKVDKNDEVGQILAASNSLVANLSLASDFAISVGKGEFKNNFQPSSENDILSKSLISMRDELQKFKSEDDKRFWTNLGVAKFADLMRENNENISILSDVFLSELVKYVDANQGAIYFARNDQNTETQLQMIACYAYQKKKFIENTIVSGEGIIGQTFKEKETIYLKEIPEDFVKITSGLGEALPTTLIVVPMKIEDEVLGVLELASFHDFEKYKIDFIENICRNLASVLQSVSNAEKMQTLVNELSLKSEQMQSQEEELRQNMEELVATQEELERKEVEQEALILKLQNEIVELKSN